MRLGLSSGRKKSRVSSAAYDKRAEGSSTRHRSRAQARARKRRTRVNPFSMGGNMMKAGRKVNGARRCRGDRVDSGRSDRYIQSAAASKPMVIDRIGARSSSNPGLGTWPGRARAAHARLDYYYLDRRPGCGNWVLDRAQPFARRRGKCGRRIACRFRVRQHDRAAAAGNGADRWRYRHVGVEQSRRQQPCGSRIRG